MVSKYPWYSSIHGIKYPDIRKKWYPLIPSYKQKNVIQQIAIFRQFNFFWTHCSYYWQKSFMISFRHIYCELAECDISSTRKSNFHALLSSMKSMKSFFFKSNQMSFILFHTWHWIKTYFESSFQNWWFTLMNLINGMHHKVASRSTSQLVTPHVTSC